MSMVCAPLQTPYLHLVFPTEATRRRRLVNLAEPSAPLDWASAPDPGLPEEQAAFVSWLFAQAGLDSRAYRSETLRRRLTACLRTLRVRTIADARRLLDERPNLIAAALSSLLVGVTSFFRDPAVFDGLARDVLPELTKNRPSLYVWSAGCSEGAELYSLAMLCAERGCLETSYLLGTDCRTDALQKARSGLFDPGLCKQVTPALVSRYFTREPAGWRIVPLLRTALRWRTADVVQLQEPGVWDIILCRNMTMYLRPDIATLLWQRLEAMLRPGGVLVLGRAERPAGVKRLTPIGGCTYRRTRG